jgi:protein-tyrosine phosphatase
MTPDEVFADASRHVLAKGACNFRDLGGYLAQDGRRVRRGLVFRSGVLDQLDAADPAVAPLPMATVIDLRTNRERTERPSNLPEPWRAGMWARDYDASGGDHTTMPKDIDAETVRATMHKVYRKMPFEQAPAYKQLFERLAAGDVPLLFHCLGGKDRTGVGAALLLDLLGVPRPVISADYAITERCLARDRFAALNGGGEPVPMPAARAPLMRSDPAYLDSMFDKIAKDFGTSERYFDEALGLGPDARQAIRALLLEEV